MTATTRRSDASTRTDALANAPANPQSNPLARLLDDLGWRPFLALADSGNMPSADIEEEDDAYVILVELPGVRRKDIDIEVDGRVVRVRAERKERERKGILRRSTRRVGEYLFETTLPGDVDADEATAEYEDGVLMLRVPKPASARGIARKISVK
jgi:HSP20 family protein